MGLRNFCQAPDKLRIVYMVTQGIAIVLHAVALAAPKWDSFNPELPAGFPSINIHQNLWEIVDNSDPIYLTVMTGVFLPRDPNDEWKKPIILLMTTGLAVGVLAIILLALTATIKKMTKNNIVCAIILSAVFVLSAGSWLYVRSTAKVIYGREKLRKKEKPATEVTYSALSFKDQHLKILSDQAYKPSYGIPVEKYGMSSGYFICLVSGAWYALSAVVALADIVKIVVQQILKNSSKIKPSDNNEQHVNNDDTKE